MPTETFTPEEAAPRISKSKPPSTSTLSRWRREGTGPEYLKIGKAVRYTQGAIDDFLNRCTVSPAVHRGEE